MRSLETIEISNSSSNLVNVFNHFKFSKMKGASVAKRRDSLKCFSNLIIRCTHFYCSLLLAPWQGLEIENCKMKWWLCEHVDVMFVIFHIWSLLLYPRFKNNKNRKSRKKIKNPALKFEKHAKFTRSVLKMFCYGFGKTF